MPTNKLTIVLVKLDAPTNERSSNHPQSITLTQAA